MSSPYRHAVLPDAHDVTPLERADRDLWPLAIAWCACAARVVAAIARGETFGAGATVALVVALALPFVVRARVKET